MAGYIGKDVVHRGHGLILDPEGSWDQLPYSTQKNIRKGRRTGFEVKRVAGTQEEMDLLRTAWYYPEDPNFPTSLGEDDVCYLAWLEGAFAGGVVLLRVGDHYFLNNLTANEVGKPYQLQSYLLWYCVEELEESDATYIDVGVSYRPNLYRFFKQWDTIHYPVIFNPPEIKPTLSFFPFAHLAEPIPTGEPDEGEKALKSFWDGDPFTFFPDRDWAEKALEELDTSWQEGTFGFGEEAPAEVTLYDLPRLFPVPYGALVRGLAIPDKQMWNRFGCLDFVKREYIYGRMEHLLDSVPGIREGRRAAHSRYEEHFAKDEATIPSSEEEVPASLRVVTEWNDLYAGRLAEFEIPHRYDEESGEIALPCHHLLNEEQVTYIYAVFRGVLNLCSEWEPTGVKGKLKER